MKKRIQTKNAVISALMIALGIVLPFLTGQIPEIGNMLLPMHIPVFMTGLLAGWIYGGAVGFILPLLRSLLFSAPMLYPNAVAMAFELMTYGITVGIVFKLIKKRNIVSVYISLICAMLAGRCLWGAVMAILLGVGENGFGIKLFIGSGFVSAIPGIIIQLILIPALMLALGRVSLYEKGRISKPSKTALSAIDIIEKKICELQKSKERVFIAIDGRCASGKSTLAHYLAKRTDAAIIHMDDFFLPPEKKTAQRLSIPGENTDHERLLFELLVPLYQKGEAEYRPFNCHTVSLGEKIRIENKRTIIVEGVYSCHRELTPYYDVKIFLSVDKETQLKRLKRRSSKQIFEKFKNEWIPLEEKYFEEYKTEYFADLKFTL